MRFSRELRAGFAVNAAVLGATFVSGREIAAFFACAGSASWLGIAASGLTFGLLAGMVCRLVGETGAHTLPGVYDAALDRRWSDAFSVTHALLMLLSGAAALSAIGDVCRLALETQWVEFALCGISALLAALISIRSMRPLFFLSLSAIPLIALFFTALALDPRMPSAVAYRVAALPPAFGSFPAALLLGVLFALLKAAMAGGIVSLCCRGLRPWLFGLCCGGIFASLSAISNLAILQGGSDIAYLTLPTVVLAARWGIPGYYLAIAALFAGAFCVLCCAVCSLNAVLSARISRGLRSFLAAGAVCLTAVNGLRPLVSIGYPVLGWICALCLGAIAVLRLRQGRARFVRLPDQLH